MCIRDRLVENYAERIDVSRGRHGQAKYLFRARILRGHHLRRTFPERLTDSVRSDELCDSKVEKLRHALVGHEYVRRFDVAMYDEILVRVSHGGADIEKESKPVLERKVRPLAVLRERTH